MAWAKRLLRDLREREGARERRHAAQRERRGTAQRDGAKAGEQGKGKRRGSQGGARAAFGQRAVAECGLPGVEVGKKGGWGPEGPVSGAGDGCGPPSCDRRESVRLTQTGLNP